MTKKMPKPNKRAPDWRTELQYMPIQLAAENIDTEKRTVDLSITSETVARRWFGSLVLGHNPGECRLDRIKQVGSFLFAHGRDPQYGVVPPGQILEVYLDEKARKYRAKLRFDDDEKSDLLWQKVQKGSLRGISVGVRFYKFLEVEEGAAERGFKGPVTIAIDWELVEISLEPTPELIVGVGLSMSDSESEPEAAQSAAGGNGLEIQKQEGKSLKFKVLRNGVELEVEESQLTAAERVQLGLDPATPTPAPQIPTPVPPAADLSAQAAAAERKRCADITAICGRFGVTEEDCLSYINDGLSIDQVNTKMLEKLAAERTAVPSVRLIKDESEKFAAAAADGLALRAGINIAKPADGANDFRGMRLLELARYCAELKVGKDLRKAGEEAVLRSALGIGEYGQFMGVSDFPNILSNVVNRSMSSAYEAANTTYQYWTRRGSLSDFRAANRLTLSQAADLEEIDENGEFTVAQFSDLGRVIQLATYGKRWGLTRKAIINDDLDAFYVMPIRFAVAARRLINRRVYNILNTNPVIDGQQLFGVAHGNTANAAVLSVNSLAAGQAAMALQMDIGNLQTLNIMPAYLLVPSERDIVARQLIASTVDPAMPNATPNPFNNRLTVLSDPELSQNSPTAWYLAGAPGITDTVEVAFLNGEDKPTIESKVEFDTLGMSWRIYTDFGVSLLDWRALYMNPGQ